MKKIFGSVASKHDVPVPPRGQSAPAMAATTSTANAEEKKGTKEATELTQIGSDANSITVSGKATAIAGHFAATAKKPVIGPTFPANVEKSSSTPNVDGSSFDEGEEVYNTAKNSTPPGGAPLLSLP